jgi:hypothetical protein
MDGEAGAGADPVLRSGLDGPEKLIRIHHARTRAASPALANTPLHDYLNPYTLRLHAPMNSPPSPAVITSKDDPTIPIAGFTGLCAESS